VSRAVLRFPGPPLRLLPEQGRSAAERALAVSSAERAERAAELQLEDPELLLALCDILRGRLETAPGPVREESEFFYGFLETPRRPIGAFDEREYFLGELALLAGTACRFLFYRDEARRWLDRAEVNLVMTANCSAHVARLSYQRLALAAEERRFEDVLEFGPRWSENFQNLGLPEEALKCRFLEAASLRELGRMAEAIEVYRDICREAERIESVRLLGQAANGLAQLYRVVGDLNEAMTYARKALPLLQELDNRINLAKLRWCVGDILREQGKKSEALQAYRAALEECDDLGMRGDAAAIHLVIADLLLDVGHEAQAEWEVRAALPIIDEEQMVPEGIAALTLLRESLRRRRIDRQALRELHGYFREE
jgi:tetratricopeptide (TPR) repeat protein